VSPFSRTPGRPLVFAHRGGRALGPENTLVAFDIGMASGADGMELDVHLSRDGRVVVCHDPTLDRTTDAQGPLADRTAAELAALNATLRFGIDLEHVWTGARAGIPTLDDVLLRYPEARMIVEIKDGSETCAAAVVDSVRRARALDRVCVGSFSLLTQLAVRAREPQLVTGAALKEGQRALYRSWIGLSPGRVPYRAFHVPEQAGRLTVVTPRFVRAAHRVDIAVHVWTVNDPADMRRLFDWGLDGIITDRPDVAVRVRDEWVHAHVGAHSMRPAGVQPEARS
jgi:glycerophosphoryl diester phosphodiesterase